MKLWYSTTSPFARKVLTLIDHHLLNGDVELLLVPTHSFDKNSPHNIDNPLGRVPALYSREGEWLYNSSFIAEYLDSLGKSRPLFPQNEHKWQTLSLHWKADGILENSLIYVSERLLRPKEEWWLERHQQLIDRNIATLKSLEKDIDSIGYELNIGTINLVCALDFLTFRKQITEVDPAVISPTLAQWAVEMNQKYTCFASSKPFVNATK